MKLLPLIFILYCCATTTGDAASLPGRPPPGVPEDSFIIRKNSQFCKDNHLVFECDFKWTQENVYLPGLSIPDHQEVILQRIHNLFLDRRACLNLSLRDVAHATAESDEDESCSNLHLSLRNVSLDAVESPVTSLHASNSRLERMTLKTVDSQLTVIGSRVGEFDVEGVVDSNVAVKLHSTKVGRLVNLHVSGGSHVLLQSVTFEEALEHSLVLASKGNLLSAVAFPPSKWDGGQPAVLLLKDGADVTLEDIQGSIKIAAPACPQALREIVIEEIATTTTAEPTEKGQSVFLLPLALSIVLNIVFAVALCLSRHSNRKREYEIKKTNKSESSLLGSSDEKFSPKVKPRKKNSILKNIQSYIRLTRRTLPTKKNIQKSRKHFEKADLHRNNMNNHKQSTKNPKHQGNNTYPGHYGEELSVQTTSEESVTNMTNSWTSTSQSDEIS